MGSHARLDWDGEQLLERVARAARLAIDDTTREAAADAAISHSWVTRTGNLDLNVVSEPAHTLGSRIVGRFGTTTMKKGKRTGWYGLFHEEGTVHEHARPFLRPAGDRHFPVLADRIRARLR